MIWVNVDIPTKMCTIHTNRNCDYIENKCETPNKGVDELKSDGGWMRFEGIVLAKKYCAENHPDFEVSEHC